MRPQVSALLAFAPGVDICLADLLERSVPSRYSFNDWGVKGLPSITFKSGGFVIADRQKDKVIIVGCSDSCMQTPFDLIDEFEFWGVNNLYWTLPNRPFTRWFEIHQIIQNDRGIWERRGKTVFREMPIESYLKQLAVLDIPTYMRQINPLIPKSELFPYDELAARFGNYFTNTISWEIALAITLGFKEIHITGVDMACDTEYGHQRPSCEYFLGVAAGLGIKIWTPDTCDLLKARFLYGRDEPEELQFRQKLDEILHNLNAKLKSENQKMENAKQEMIKYHGAIVGVQNVDKIWKNITGG
jgi:hypothetical protein